MFEGRAFVDATGRSWERKCMESCVGGRGNSKGKMLRGKTQVRYGYREVEIYWVSCNVIAFVGISE